MAFEKYTKVQTKQFFAVLAILQKHPDGLRAYEIAREIKVTSIAAYNILAELEKQRSIIQYGNRWCLN